MPLTVNGVLYDLSTFKCTPKQRREALVSIARHFEEQCKLEREFSLELMANVKQTEQEIRQWMTETNKEIMEQIRELGDLYKKQTETAKRALEDLEKEKQESARLRALLEEKERQTGKGTRTKKVIVRDSL